MSFKFSDAIPLERIRVENLWLLFSSVVIPHVSVNSVQHIEMRKAFYAGFIDAFKLMTEVSAELPEDKAMNVLSNLREEADQFIAEEIRKAMNQSPK